MIASYAQLLQLKYGDRLDEDANQYIGYMVEGTRRLEALIQDMLTFSRIANVENVPRTEVSLDAVVEWALENLQIAIQNSGAVVEVGSLGTVTGNQVQLLQLFQNLIGNAIKYRKPDEAPKIRIQADRRNGAVTVAVEDNGIGIEPEYHDRIFGIFKRLSRDTQGTGIGLAICKKIVEKHGGRIWLQSALGVGSTFSVVLPADSHDLGGDSRAPGYSRG